jgi:hypothetical protein
VLASLPEARLRVGDRRAPVARFRVGAALAGPPPPREMAVVLKASDAAGGGAAAIPPPDCVDLRLSAGLGLPRPWAPAGRGLCKLLVYVPDGHLDGVRDAMAVAAAGHAGRYSDRTVAVRGVGTYRPRLGTRPFGGAVGERALAGERRLEAAVVADRVRAVLAAMHAAHPYEEVAYDLTRAAGAGRGGGGGRGGGLAAASFGSGGRAFVRRRPAAGGACARAVRSRCGIARMAPPRA